MSRNESLCVSLSIAQGDALQARQSVHLQQERFTEYERHPPENYLSCRDILYARLAISINGIKSAILVYVRELPGMGEIVHALLFSRGRDGC